jgi:hypothetical protein
MLHAYGGRNSPWPTLRMRLHSLWRLINTIPMVAKLMRKAAQDGHCAGISAARGAAAMLIGRSRATPSRLCGASPR